MPLNKGNTIKRRRYLVLLLILFVLTFRVAIVHKYTVKSVVIQKASAYLNVYSHNVYRYPFVVFVDNPHAIYVYVSPYQNEENIKIDKINIEIDGFVKEFKDYGLLEVNQGENEKYQIIINSVNLPKNRFSLEFLVNAGGDGSQNTYSLKFNFGYKKNVSFGNYLYDHVSGI